jgi:hypothetical protein
MLAAFLFRPLWVLGLRLITFLPDLLGQSDFDRLMC